MLASGMQASVLEGQAEVAPGLALLCPMLLDEPTLIFTFKDWAAAGCFQSLGICWAGDESAG